MNAENTHYSGLAHLISKTHIGLQDNIESDATTSITVLSKGIALIGRFLNTPDGASELSLYDIGDLGNFLASLGESIAELNALTAREKIYQSFVMKAGKDEDREVTQ